MTLPQTFDLALQRHRAGRLADAEALYRQILAAQPKHAQALHFLGVLAHQTGRHDFALEWIREAIALDPNNPAAYCNLGEVFRAKGRLDEAIAACRRALELKPDYPKALYNLGVTLKDRGHLDEAIAAYRQALALKPDMPDAHNNLGTTLREQGQLGEAEAAYRRALELKPDYAEVHSNLVSLLHFDPRHTERTILEERQRWNRQFSDPLKPFLQPHANDRNPGRRLRIGYVSQDFWEHVVGRYLLPLFERQDREQFEIFCYSGVTRPDSMTERLRALTGPARLASRSDAGGGWRNTVGVSDARLAEMIREDEVDILVDLAMHTAGNRLPMFARHPAPVQVAWLAYPGSTGVESIGYRLTDTHLDPPGERPPWSSEEPVRLPDCWCCYQPIGGSPEVNQLPAASMGGVTFGSLNNFTKVNESVLALWARVLEAVKGSRLVMLCPEGRTRERVRTCFRERNIATERLELVSMSRVLDYLRTYQRIDLGLDPFPCNGMATTCDALWMGVPVLTLPGEMPASRAGLSLLSTVGLAELAASSEEDYVRIAVELAGDLPRLANLRSTLRPRMQASPLMDAPRFARNVETAYRSMWKRWCAKASPVPE